MRSQRRSVGWSVGVIGLAVLWRSVGLTALALAVNLLPVGMIIALQGLPCAIEFDHHHGGGHRWAWRWMIRFILSHWRDERQAGRVRQAPDRHCG